MALTEPTGYFSIINGPINEALDPIQAFQNEVDAALTSLTGGVPIVALGDPGSNGILVRDSSGHTIARNLANASAGLTWMNSSGVSGNPTPIFANDLGALESLTGTGLARRTATDSWALDSTSYSTLTNSASLNVLPKTDGSGNLINSNITDTGFSLEFGLTLVPSSAGGIAIGTSSLPFASILIGNAAGTYHYISSNASSARSATFPDASGNIVLDSATQSLTNKKLGSLTTNGPIYTSGGDGTLNSEAVLNSIRGGTGINNAGTLTNASNTTITGGGTLALGGFTFTVPATGTGVLTSRTITEGVGLAGNTYDLSTNRTLAMGTPSSLTATSTNTASGTTHTHVIDSTIARSAITISVSGLGLSGGGDLTSNRTITLTSSSNPGAAASILATDSSGYLTIVRLTATGYVFVNTATANLYLKDTSTGFQSASSTVVTLQGSNAFQSTSFTSGLIGWGINAGGDAEFANVTVRGALRSSILLYNAVMTTAGTQAILPSAGKLKNDVVVTAGPTYGTTTFSIDIVDQEGLSHANSQLFVTGDILYMKDGLTGATWFKVTAVSDQTTFWRYTASIQAGTANITYGAGLGVGDYGVSGKGGIILTADQSNAPYLQMFTHVGTFSSGDASGTLTVTPQLRLGNLSGSYGFTSVAQVETATVIGTITGSGNATVVVTAAGMSNSPKTVSVAVLNTDTATIVGGKIRAALALDPDVNAFFIISGATTSVILTVKEISANDATLNISIANGTCTGLTAAPASANTTAGVADSYGFGTGQYGVASKSWITVEPVNGFRIGNNTTILGQWDASGVITVGQVASSQSNILISSGALDLRVNTSIRTHLATDGSGYFANSLFAFDTSGNVTISGNAVIGGVTIGSGKIYIGTGTYNNTNTSFYVDSTGQMSLKDKFVWSGSALTINGTVTATAGTIGGWTLGATSLTSGSGATTVGVDSGGTNPAFYAGSATPGSAPFRVTNAGALTATSGTIGGWTIGSAKISSTGIDINSGASAALSFGTTPPTSAAAGSGIWLDKTGLYQLVLDKVRVQLDGNGLQIKTENSSYATLSFTSSWYTGSSYTLSSSLNARQDASGNANVFLLSQGSPGSGGSGSVQFNAAKSDGSKDLRFDLFSGGSTMYSQFYAASGTFAGLTIGANAAPNSMLDVRGDAVITGILKTGSGPTTLTNAAGQILTSVIIGTGTDDNAASGIIGEVLSQSVATGSPTALTSGVAANMTASPLTLTPGDWDVEISANFQTGTNTAVTIMLASISEVSATLDASAGRLQVISSGSVGVTQVNGIDLGVQVIPHRVTVAVSTTKTIYCVVRGNFTVSTLAAWGTIRATRRR